MRGEWEIRRRDRDDGRESEKGEGAGDERGERMEVTEYRWRKERCGWHQAVEEC